MYFVTEVGLGNYYHIGNHVHIYTEILYKVFLSYISFSEILP